MPPQASWQACLTPAPGLSTKEPTMTITTTYSDKPTTIGNPNVGCRHCGTVIERRSSNTRVTLYHPGVTCCADAIKDQIRYREADFHRLQDQARLAIGGIEDLERKASQAIGKEQSELMRQATQARSGYEHLVARINRELNGDADQVGLKAEIRNLRQQLARLEDDLGF